MLKILISGFMPFDQENINPSFEAIKNIQINEINLKLIRIELPVEFTQSSQLIIEKISEKNPDIILMIGQAGGREYISLERIAINLDDATIADNIGKKPIDQQIIKGGSSAYFQTLPIKKLYTALKEKNIPVIVSNTAGTYVCNHIMYSVLHYLRITNHHAIAGFIHVPYSHEQTQNKPNVFSMNLEEITSALEIIIQTLIEVNK